jgi:hypothetical protein
MQNPNGKQETLADVLGRLNLSRERLTIEALDVEVGLAFVHFIILFNFHLALILLYHTEALIIIYS